MPGSQETSLRPSSRDPSWKGVAPSMKLRTPGLAAGAAIVAALSAAPALAAGPTVKVRVEGETGTLLERTQVTLDGSGVPGNSGCDGRSAGAAIEAATHGNWDRAPGGFATTIEGESHDYSRTDYWAEWLDSGAGYKRGGGVCTDELSDGDEVLMLVDMPPYGEGSTTEVPLSLAGVPAQAQQGDTVTVTVLGARSTSQYGDPGDGTNAPVAGATVTGGAAPATSGADGRATVQLGEAGDVRLKAAKAGDVPSAAEVVHVAAPGAAPVTSTATPTARDTTAPTARLRGIRDGHRYASRHAPRTIRGSVSADPSGLRAVKLSLTRSRDGRCALYSPTRERFRPSRCGRRVYFKIGDREAFSYLLPSRLGPGRYVLDAVAVDTAGNRDAIRRGRNRAVFTVR
jgi:hypothetical protein